VLAAVLGVLSGVVGAADGVPYVRDVLRGATRPHRGTWLIWSGLAIVVVLSQWADGATLSLIMPATGAVLTGVVFALAIRRGVGGVSTPERVMVGIAVAGVLGWLLADEPVVATACVVVADLVGAAIMVPKTWRDPHSETFATYALGSLSGALAAGAVGALDVSLLLYPVYYCLANGALAMLIVQRRSRLAGRPRVPS
jgi:hypothetical protein